eukprot:CAMPEP_0194029422 /NCGR_PEP_ID=MMETSP0009_2-20130614/3136_1 /TAXON_ID=210454 /ORGANISM="Grammatophora oceanica, Strain CCMP 410" /LENGTH=308 /DNA_ID=CAMNT_0038669073 /DNA_START=233 /DNA_END=1159 /DNA_ORIENTATION=-
MAPFLADNGVRAQYDADLPPLVLAAGQGTTGTHAMFDATCELGLPSVHFRKQCAPRDPSPATRRGIKAHLKLLELFDRIRRTCQQSPQADECKFEHLPGLMHDMKRQVTKIVNGGGVLAVHDSPYTNLLRHLQRTVVPSDRLLIVTSERNPSAWAEKRAMDHPMEFVCREVFEHLMNRPTIRSDQPLVGAAFDMDECLLRALKRQKEEISFSPSYFQDVFVSYQTLVEEAGANETALQLLFRANEIAVEHYQDHVRRHLLPIYTLNLWDRPSAQSSTRTDASEISKEVMSAVLERRPTLASLFAGFER